MDRTGCSTYLHVFVGFGLVGLEQVLGAHDVLGEFEPNPSAIVHNVIFDDDGDNRVAISHYALGFEYVDLQRPSVPVELRIDHPNYAGKTAIDGEARASLAADLGA